MIIENISFLPPNFDPKEPIALLAGRGDYPLLVWENMKKICNNPYFFSFEPDDVNDVRNIVSEDRFFMCKLEQISTWISLLKKVKIKFALLAGQIKPKRLFHGLKPDLKAVLLLAKLKNKNASTIFGALIKEIEKIGVYALDARCFVESQLVEKGFLTSKKINLNEKLTCNCIKICKGIANLNIGQSIIVNKGTTLIVEGFDGTDAMIERAGKFDNCKEMCLIKASKDDHDFRFDVPVFGINTVHKMHEFGVKAALLESRKTIIIDKFNVLNIADDFGISIAGF